MRALFTALIAALAISAAFAASVPADTVNKKCPISDMPVKEGVVVSTDAGDIGVCCGSCQKKVAAWDDAKKAKFVANATASTSDDDAKKSAGAASDAKVWTEPYLLNTCAASGRPIDVKGTPTTKIIDGRELKFCCGGCAAAVAKDPAKWLPKVDKAITARQMAIYPTTTCIVSGEPLMEDGKDTGVSMVVNNRLFRVCCKMCARKVKADPAKYAAKLDGMAMKAQSKAYPLKTCVVASSNALGDSPKQMMVGGRLVQTCCGGCAKKVTADPAKYVAVVDAAWAKTSSDVDTDGAAKAKKAAKTDADR
jgi:hypothetical protein